MQYKLLYIYIQIILSYSYTIVTPFEHSQQLSFQNSMHYHLKEINSILFKQNTLTVSRNINKKRQEHE